MSRVEGWGKGRMGGVCPLYLSGPVAPFLKDVAVLVCLVA